MSRTNHAIVAAASGLAAVGAAQRLPGRAGGLERKR
jgi:hypothetical protein